MTDPIEAIVETGIYVQDLDQAQRFYQGLLGLEVIAREEGRHVFFRVGQGQVLLAFIAARTSTDDHPPPHGASGAGHFALGVRAAGLDAWRQRLLEQGVAIEREIEWPRGGRSVYFRDPSGNLVELITPGVWGLPQGW